MRDTRCGNVIRYDIDLVSGKCRQVYEGRGIGLIASTLYLVSRFSIEKVMIRADNWVDLAAHACQKFASLEPSVI